MISFSVKRSSFNVLSGNALRLRGSNNRSSDESIEVSDNIFNTDQSIYILYNYYPISITGNSFVGEGRLEVAANYRGDIDISRNTFGADC